MITITLTRIRRDTCVQCGIKLPNDFHSSICAECVISIKFRKSVQDSEQKLHNKTNNAKINFSP